MTIHLSKDLEQFVHDAVRAGLYAREDDVIRDALTRLQQAMPEAKQTGAVRARSEPRPRPRLQRQRSRCPTRSSTGT